MDCKQEIRLAEVAVSSDINAGHGVTQLPLLLEKDEILMAAEKVKMIADTVERGRSAAIVTGVTGAAHEERDPETLAKVAMKPCEKRMYDAWANGATITPIKWATSIKDPPIGVRTIAKFTAHAAALDIIYRQTTTSIPNAVWFFANMPYAVPLVTAVERVEKAKRHWVESRKGLTDMELAEIRVCHDTVSIGGKIWTAHCIEYRKMLRDVRGSLKVIKDRLHSLKLLESKKNLTDMELAEIRVCHEKISVATDCMTGPENEHRKISNIISVSTKIVQDRVHDIKMKIPSAKRKRDPIAESQALESLPRVVAKIVHTKAAMDARAERGNLLAGTGLTNAGLSNYHARKRVRQDPSGGRNGGIIDGDAIWTTGNHAGEPPRSDLEDGRSAADSVGAGEIIQGNGTRGERGWESG